MAFQYSSCTAGDCVFAPFYPHAESLASSCLRGFQTRQAVFKHFLVSTFLPRRGSSSAVGSGWSSNPGREAGGGAEEEG